MCAEIMQKEYIKCQTTNDLMGINMIRITIKSKF